MAQPERLIAHVLQPRAERAGQQRQHGDRGEVGQVERSGQVVQKPAKRPKSIGVVRVARLRAFLDGIEVQAAGRDQDAAAAEQSRPLGQVRCRNAVNRQGVPKQEIELALGTAGVAAMEHVRPAQQMPVASARECRVNQVPVRRARPALAASVHWADRVEIEEGQPLPQPGLVRQLHIGSLAACVHVVRELTATAEGALFNHHRADSRGSGETGIFEQRCGRRQATV